MIETSANVLGDGEGGNAGVLERSGRTPGRSEWGVTKSPHLQIKTSEGFSTYLE